MIPKDRAVQMIANVIAHNTIPSHIDPGEHCQFRKEGGVYIGIKTHIEAAMEQANPMAEYIVEALLSEGVCLTQT